MVTYQSIFRLINILKLIMVATTYYAHFVFINFNHQTFFENAN